MMNPKKGRIPGRCSHLLDDQNYGDWKVHMSTLIKSLGMEVCQFVVTGWTTLTKTEKGRTLIKPESK